MRAVVASYWSMRAALPRQVGTLSQEVERIWDGEEGEVSGQGGRERKAQRERR